MGESNPPISTGCGDEGTANLLGDYDPAWVGQAVR